MEGEKARFEVATICDGGVGKTAMVIKVGMPTVLSFLSTLLTREQFCLDHSVEFHDPTTEDVYLKQILLHGSPAFVDIHWMAKECCRTQ
ncbi:hypothetical protein PG996_006869 [Apiospora saccharicola]|uniref:Uncharacterized protein n=1 Tax=Apiospora saccharicola TaxID=335842 RepID=A0ABR1V980_9PEZI